MKINPMTAVESPKTVKPDTEYLIDDHVRKVIAAASGNQYETLYWLALHAGMRWGELAGLLWKDVDLDKGVIHVRRAQQEIYDPTAPKGKRHRIELGPPKSKAGRRSIRLGESMAAMMRLHCGNTTPLPAVRVFTTMNGQPLRKSNFGRREWKPLLKAAGVPDYQFKSLRHTMATMALTHGVHGKTVQERLGHSSIVLTLDTYSSVIPEVAQEAAAVLESALQTGTNPGTNASEQQ